MAYKTSNPWIFVAALLVFVVVFVSTVVIGLRQDMQAFACGAFAVFMLSWVKYDGKSLLS